MGKAITSELFTAEDEAIIENSLVGEWPEEAHGTDWPGALAPEALYGLAGEIVKTIGPETEADPAALLFSFFILFGNVIGREAHFMAEADRHYMNLFVCLVGTTSKGRKGVSLGQIKQLFRFDEEWARNRINQGLSSGEGLIWACRDEQRETKRNKSGEEKEYITVDGIDDKRLMVVETEFASTIRVLRREGNTLSAIVRKAWDDGNLQALTKNSPAKATGAHVSILSHITKDELLKYLEDTEAANGFGNRFLWVCVRRSNCLPEGGRLHEVDFTDTVKRLRQAVEFGTSAGELKRDEAARALWREIYPELSAGRPGLCGSMLARSEAQVMRVACIYALLDLSNVVRVEHLTAALAVWDFAEASAKFIFGDSLGDPTADEILKILQKAGSEGMTRMEINNHFGRHKRMQELRRAFNVLAERGLAVCCKEVGQGRPVERWFSNNQGAN